jgi:TusA-related sulfurtransferase
METSVETVIKPDVEIDLKGEVCPYTFVYSKLAIEEMEHGEILRVIVDHIPATKNVPRSMENEGHAVLRVAQINDTDWEMVIKKNEG